jgi:AAA15 family ATPase/GTPase
MREKDESGGTQKLFSYSIPILHALAMNIPLFIDELDARLHPLILENIIRLFNFHRSSINPSKAQLIFSTHSTQVLTNKHFGQDRIWFCEKDKYGATDLYSLAEYKAVRKDASFDKDYLLGKYGAIPYVDSILLQLDT